MLTFSAVFFVAFVYAVARGALDWGPLKKGIRVDMGNDPMKSASRTVLSTVKRVGLEGRQETAA
jgi:hypothetical protein